MSNYHRETRHDCLSISHQQKVKSNPRMFRYCRKLLINHCSSDQSERNKSCTPATICTLLNEYIHKRPLNSFVFVNIIFLNHHKRPRVILPQEKLWNVFSHTHSKNKRSKIKPKQKKKRKNWEKKVMTSMAIIQKGRILSYFILFLSKGYYRSVLLIGFLNSIWRWSNNIPQ